MEGLLAFTLFGSVLAFWGLILLFVISLFICERTKSGIWAFASFIVVITVMLVRSNVDLLSLFDTIKVSIYLGIGFLFSMMRAFFYARRKKNSVIENIAEAHQEDALKYAQQAVLRELKGNVFRWWFMWPASLLYWILSDLVADLWNALYKKLQKLFEGIVKLGFK